ncbi:MAG: NAD(P)-dependent oxidoreductase [Selenomonadaceae bacterium]|nr:NAD(P)-dependent oxidoreductase [Selenomonadaceae bacterium]
MDPVNHQVLLAGRGGFYAQSIAQVFRQEGWEVFRLGEKATASEKDAGVHFCAYHGEDLEAEDFFRTHAVSHIVYLLDEAIVRGDLADLQAVLRLGHQFHVRHFFLLSSAEVFPAGGSPRSEEEVPAPETELGKLYYLAEECARNWQRVYGLPVTILRCPDAYGPGQSSEDGWMGKFLSGICGGKPVLPAEEEARRDFLWMDDLALAVYRAVARGYEGEFLHISSGSPVSWRELQSLCPEGVQEASRGKEPLKTEFSQALLDSGRCSRELGWQARQDLKDGFGKACQAMADHLAGRGILEEEKKKEQEREGRKNLLLPYAKNLAGFLLMVLVAKLQGNLVVNPVIYFDMNFLYIGAMGLLYGKRHALLACLLSSLLLAWTLVGRGMDVVGILYVPQYLLHFTSYLFAAILTGYFADCRENEQEAAQWMDSRHRERYAFLRQMYMENTELKDRLHRQIANMDDGIGRRPISLRKPDSEVTHDGTP